MKSLRQINELRQFFQNHCTEQHVQKEKRQTSECLLKDKSVTLPMFPDLFTVTKNKARVI